MSIKIEKQITGFQVKKPEDASAAPADTSRARSGDRKTAEIIQMHEKVERPPDLEGATYKIKSPLFDHALYVTINDIILNRGTEHELRRPFEIFINSKSMDHFQWIVALTRIMSAVFRKGGDVTFLVEEMKAVFDPRGGYFKEGGKFMPSIVAEIGEVLEIHMKRIGLIEEEGLSPEQKELILAKKAEHEALKKNRDEHRDRQADEATRVAAQDETFPSDANVCGKCSTKAVIRLDGCDTCLNCGESKCG